MRQTGKGKWRNPADPFGSRGSAPIALTTGSLGHECDSGHAYGARGSSNGERFVTSVRPSKRSAFAFYVLVFVLAFPIWALSGFLGTIDTLKVPVADLVLAFTPLAGALILVFRAEGSDGLISFLKRVFDYRTLARSRWIWTALLLAPLVYALTYAVLHLAGHRGEPMANLLGLSVLAPIMFLLAIGEEAGWTGYLLDPLQERFGALGASLIIAVPWWLAHIPSIIEIGGTAPDIAWWLPGAIALRVLMTSLYNNAGRSIPAVIIFHTMLNVGRSIAYPTIGSHYDPAYQVTGFGIAFAMAAIVVLVWGAHSLTKAAPIPSTQ